MKAVMRLKSIISPPFFEIGPKAYLYGEAAVELAVKAAEASRVYGVKVIYTPQISDIHACAQMAGDLLICAQHIDAIMPGRGQGAILPEAVKAAGARCAMLNHAEKPITLAQLAAGIKRAREAGLLSIVCADSCAEAGAVAKLRPDVIVAEPTELIGNMVSSDEEYVRASIAAVKSVDAGILVLQGAGISSPEDVYRVILAGADATGSSSAVCKAPDPGKMACEMLRAAREAYDERVSRNK